MHINDFKFNGNILIFSGGSAVTKRSLDVSGGIKGVESDAKLKPSGSEKQTSRIQVKKGPNGQDYEYEYVYYYYDEDEDSVSKDQVQEKKGNEISDAAATNSIQQSNTLKNSRYTSIDRSSSTGTAVTVNTEASSNEVAPRSTRTRGRSSSSVETKVEEVSEERLPSNTRFPPRSRNLSTSTTTTTTAAPEPEKKRISKPRGRPTPAQQDVVEETHSTRPRSRPNIKRPSLELVDSASFKTHASDVSVSQYKDLPSREETASTATARSFDTDAPRAQSLDSSEKVKTSDVAIQQESSTTDNTVVTTTLTDDMTAAMDKVALDLYAILQGTQNMIDNGESQVSTPYNLP